MSGERTRKRGRWGLPALVVCSLLLVLGAAVSLVRAQSAGYTLSWWTVDGGGSTVHGGDYTLSSTIGQPDAATWAGGRYTLAGGFWGRAERTHCTIYVPVVQRE